MDFRMNSNNDHRPTIFFSKVKTTGGNAILSRCRQQKHIAVKDDSRSFGHSSASPFFPDTSSFLARLSKQNLKLLIAHATRFYAAAKRLKDFIERFLCQRIDSISPPGPFFHQRLDIVFQCMPFSAACDFTDSTTSLGRLIVIVIVPILLSIAF